MVQHLKMKILRQQQIYYIIYCIYLFSADTDGAITNTDCAGRHPRAGEDQKTPI